VLDELCNDENHVSGIRHHVEQIQGFSFERLVLIFQTVDDDHLMLGSILGIHSNNARESSDTQISQIVIVARQKSGHTVCSSVEQARVGVNHRNRANALVTENDLSKTKKKKKKQEKQSHTTAYPALIPESARFMQSNSDVYLNIVRKTKNRGKNSTCARWTFGRSLPKQPKFFFKN
jgi:hypothetical protein